MAEDCRSAGSHDASVHLPAGCRRRLLPSRTQIRYTPRHRGSQLPSDEQFPQQGAHQTRRFQHGSLGQGRLLLR